MESLVFLQAIGTYTFEVWVIDSKGNSSNKLSGTFEIKIDDTGTQWTTRTSGTTVNLRRIEATEKYVLNHAPVITIFFFKVLLCFLNEDNGIIGVVIEFKQLRIN